MTQIFKEDGTIVPVTRIIAGPCFVTDKKTVEKDGYVAIQVCFQEKRKKANKAVAGKFKKVFKNDNNFQTVKEFRLDSDDKMAEKLNLGDKVTVEALSEGDIVDVQGVSKGKGFQGVVKRHGFHGGNKSHGNKDQLRMPGSIGATGPAHVLKGMKMGGHMGNQGVTLKNLEIVKIVPEENVLYITGAVPGARNGFLFLRAEGEFEPSVDKIEEPKKEEKQPVDEKKKEKANVEALKAEDKPTEEVKLEEKKVEEKAEKKKEEVKDQKIDQSKENK